MKKRKWISKADLLVAAVLLLCAAGGLFWRAMPQDAAVAQVTVDGTVVLQVDLQDAAEAKTYTLENGVILKAENHAICFAHADCRDAVCVHTGALFRVGDVAACLPNRTVVAVVGATDDVDILTY